MGNTTELRDEKTNIAELVRRWGSSSSNAILDPAFQIFTIPNIEGIIGYRTVSNRAVVLGDPVTSTKDLLALTQAFHTFCKDKGMSIIYLTVSENFVSTTLQNGLCHAKVRIGSEYYIDPKTYPQTGPNGRLLKKKVKHAQGENVLIEEYTEYNPIVEEAIENAAKAWLKARHGPQIYMSDVHLFSDSLGKRWFYAKQNGKIVGVLLFNRLERYQGWLLNLLMPTPESPNGTSEILALTAFDKLAAEGCQYVSFGTIASLTLDEFQGFNLLSQWIAGAAFKAADKLFHLEGKRKFWEKFEPQGTPLYVLFSKPTIHLGDLVAISQSLNVSIK